MPECEALRGDGQRCQAVAVRGSGLCAAHHPNFQEQRRRGAVKGGRRGGRGRGGELTQAKNRLHTLAEDVVSGTLDTKRATAAAMVWNAWLRAQELERKLKEADELEQRLDELEDQLRERLK